MEDLLEKNNGLSDSGEVPVDFEVEIQGENGNQTHKETDVNSINVEGSVSGNWAGHSATNVEKPVEKFELGTSQPVKAGRHKQNQNRALGLLAAKLFDDKVPLRKKLKLFNRLATVQDDGTVQFEVPGDIKPGKLDFGTGVVYNGASDEAENDVADIPELPPLQIAMLIVGTRGDVQPFVAIGKKLQENGHRVRLATHANFKEFVLGAGLEFYPLGGDPKVLAAYMVKNKGFLPSGPSEIFIQRNQIKDIVFSLLPACVDPDPESNVPFKVNAIIANPPAYDWGPKIDVVGFCFLDLASNYEPPESLVKWLEDGEKPIYIGFGSLPVQEPAKMTEIIVEALEMTGQRGIINKGWGGLGSLKEPKDFVYLLDNCPHDWLFLQCAAVVHHGGAGTTAAGLKTACPTTVIPFFGDQPFWGERVHARGVGPAPIPVDEFSLEKLVAAIRFMLDPKVKERAVELAKSMEHEDGVSGAVKAFHKHFPRESLEPKPEVSPRPHHFFSLRRCFGHSKFS
ncbi:sterol 3-beta-glucosyltransferase UGT80A2-like isoform X2 [Solanum dulcamara]|uniref:sterol 3-beta-glucosyltransferase UGT80A2-like isoform X2 n=1 Tax=Solanum dulcamara TaxID=45834 RepID=UPI0024866F2D|nr:sterol 3-beta-glucosyltransferase UGT80A2-like isoform X2 [Solanum dulcamara]